MPPNGSLESEPCTSEDTRGFYVKCEQPARILTDFEDSEGLPFLLSPARVARELDYSRRHIYQLIADGKLPAEKIGYSVRIRRSDLLAFIAGGGRVAGEEK